MRGSKGQNDDSGMTRRGLLGTAASVAFSALPTVGTQAEDALHHAPSGLLLDLMAFPERTPISNAKPCFSWIVNDAAPNAVQRAFQILVATSIDLLTPGLADLWDSGKVPEARSNGIAYTGKPLPETAEIFWKVRTWGSNKVSAYSKPQRFRTGRFSIPRMPYRYPIEQSRVDPVAIIDKGDGRWFLDFGRAAFGQLHLTASRRGAEAITIELGEKQIDHSVDNHPGGSVRYRKVKITDQIQTLVAPDTVMPFRYAEVSGIAGALAAENVRQVVNHYPFDDNAAHFSCSDNTLNEVWELCKYSIKATSFLGIYVDGDRERKPYEADAYINQLCHYCVDREYTLARYSHEYLMHNATWPTEWPLHSVLMAWNDCLYTGDSNSLAVYYEELKAKTLVSLSRSDGLISSTSPAVTSQFLKSIYAPKLQDIVDWPAAERDNFKFSPINTVVNALHYFALACMSKIAGALGKGEDEAHFSGAASRVRNAFFAVFYNPATGLMRDGEGVEHYSLHSTAFAMAVGILPEVSMIPGVVQFLRAKGMACSVYGAQHLLEGLYNAGASDLAFDLMTSKSERSWKHMLDLGSTVTLEAWDPRFKPNLDWNHAWGAAPANIIPRRLMGVRPTEPGYRKLEIRPQIAKLTAASLKLPTIAGPITMQVHSNNGGYFHMEVGLPANTHASVFVPAVGSRILLDGKQLHIKPLNGCYRLDGVGSGGHSFESHS